MTRFAAPRNHFVPRSLANGGHSALEHVNLVDVGLGALRLFNAEPGFGNGGFMDVPKAGCRKLFSSRKIFS